jgi:beta-fructofuranosidase
MNDPCAPFYNPGTGLYHVSFQWNPRGPDWGDICWGSASSPDLVHWKVETTPSILPDSPYDCEGVFTGCHIPLNSKKSKGRRNEVLTVAYTSVNELPIHHTLPHAKGSESLSLVQSFNNGRTWHKHPSNPILPREPRGLEVTAYRDPFVAPWRSMSQELSLDLEHTLFGIISGGIRDSTPTTFLYAIDRNDLATWNYVGPLVDIGCNKKLSRWSGDLGKNWEVVNFMTLMDESDNSVERDFLIMGAEGCLPSIEGPTVGEGLVRPERGQLWMSGTPVKAATLNTSPVTIRPNVVGYLDHGCLYAANSFHDSTSGKQIVWGWVTEDDLCDELRHAQGWSGLLSLPRELRIQTLEHVVRARLSHLEEITSIEIETENDVQANEKTRQLSTIRTLASEPVSSVVESLRRHHGVRMSNLSRMPLCSALIKSAARFTSAELQTSTWELGCSMKVSQACTSIGFSLSHSADRSIRTTLSFFPRDETVTIARPSLPGPGSGELVNSKTEHAPHTLFTSLDQATGFEIEETLDLRVWRDKSVLEVFVSGRTAITTRIYAGDENFDMSFFAEDVDGAESSELVSATLWDGIGL